MNNTGIMSKKYKLFTLLYFSVGNRFTPRPGSFWIQVRLVPAKYVTGVITQGRPTSYVRYVSSYKISYSNDGKQFFSINKVFNKNKLCY